MRTATYSAWRNVSVSETTGDTIVSREPFNRCPHCSNTGLVILDQQPTHLPVAAPCPMCALGGIRAVEYANGRLAPPGSHADNPLPRSHAALQAPHYWHNVDLDTVSWQGGLTARHDRRCSTYGCHTLVTTTGPCPSCQPVHHQTTTQEQKTA